MPNLSRWSTAATFAVLALTTTRAGAYAVGPRLGIEALAKSADVVWKGTVVSDHAVTDRWFEDQLGYEVHDTALRVVSMIKGPAGAKTIVFRHYAHAAGRGEGMYTPQHYEFTVGGSYLVFAATGGGAVYRQLSKAPTGNNGGGVIHAADAQPVRGKTITDIAWAELDAQLASTVVADAVRAIAELDEMSGGHASGLADFDRHRTLDAIRPIVRAASPEIATAAISVFGADSPYFDDSFAAFWFAGLGHGTIAGMGASVAAVPPTVDVAVADLLAVADSAAPATIRALAIRALGHSRAIAAGKLVAWGHDPDALVRAAAVLLSAEHVDRALIHAGATDAAAEVRIAAAHAIGFTQDVALVHTLDALLKDATPKVREAAALALLSFAADVVAVRDAMTANLGSDYRPLFINALARRDAQPYLALLGEVIVKHLEPQPWWGGAIPAGDSWAILFAYVAARPAGELAAGKLDASLDALEQMQWFGSSEPRALYALYLARRLPARAKRFRAAARKTIPYSMDEYFDMADKDPTAYLP